MSPQIFSKLFSKPLIKQFFKFAIVGAIGTLVNILVLYIFTEFFKVFYIISEIFAFFSSSVNNYLLDKYWTFQEDLKEKIVPKYFQFVIISLISLTVNLSILYIAVEYFNYWYVFAEVGAILIVFLINFVGNKLWTFRTKPIV